MPSSLKEVVLNRSRLVLPVNNVCWMLHVRRDASDFIGRAALWWFSERLVYRTITTCSNYLSIYFASLLSTMCSNFPCQAAGTKHRRQASKKRSAGQQRRAWRGYTQQVRLDKSDTSDRLDWLDWLGRLGRLDTDDTLGRLDTLDWFYWLHIWNVCKRGKRGKIHWIDCIG